MNDQNNSIESNVGSVIGEFAHWKGRGSLKSLVAELERQIDSKFDFIMDVRDMRIEVCQDTGYPRLVPNRLNDWLNQDGLPLSMKAFKQLAARFQDRNAKRDYVSGRGGPAIPGTYIESEWRAHPDLLAQLVSGKMSRTKTRWLIRCLDDRVRAVLSDRYSIIDNYDIAKAALAGAKEMNAKVFDCSLSESNMRIKLVRKDIWDEVDFVRSSGPSSNWFAGGLGNQEFLSKVAAHSRGQLPGENGGDGGEHVTNEKQTHPIVTISNSETGDGRTNGRLGVMGAVCYNLATVEEVLAEVHIGGRQQVGVFSAETIRREGELTYRKVGDLVRSGFNEEMFRERIQLIKGAENRPVHDPSSAVANVVANSKLSDEDGTKILEYFLQDYKPTQMGLAQAVARRAQDLECGDKAHDFEWAAGQLMLAK